MKSVAIVGGLGYLGSTLKQMLEPHVKELIVIDNNMFGKWRKDEVKEVWNIEECDVNALPEVVVICSNIDIPEFYECGLFTKYIDTYRECVNNIILSGRTVWFVAPSNKIKFQFHDQNVHVVHCPQLFGTSKGMRTDTVVNSMVIELLLTKRLMLDDPMEQIIFCSLRRYADMLVQAILGNSMRTFAQEAEFSIAPKMVIASMIMKQFNPHEYGFGINFQSKGLLIPNSKCCVEKKDAQALELFVTEITEAMKIGFADDVNAGIYDNTFHIESMIRGHKYRGMYV